MKPIVVFSVEALVHPWWHHCGRVGENSAWAVVSGSKNYSAQTNVYTSCIAPDLDLNSVCTYLSWVLFYFQTPTPRLYIVDFVISLSYTELVVKRKSYIWRHDSILSAFVDSFLFRFGLFGVCFWIRMNKLTYDLKAC